MNVNPFSYLIEKLKGKVDKSGDTMSGNLSVQVSGNAYLKVTNTDKSVDATLNSASNGQHGLYSNGYNDGTFHDSGKWLINRQADGSTMINGNVEVPSQTGTLALKSDVFKGQATAVLVKKITTTATSYAFDESLANYKMVSICVNWDLGGDSNHTLYAVGEPFPQSGAATYIYLNNDVNGPYAVVESMSNTSITIRGTSPSIGIRVYGIK